MAETPMLRSHGEKRLENGAVARVQAIGDNAILILRELVALRRMIIAKGVGRACDLQRITMTTIPLHALSAGKPGGEAP